MKEYLCNTRKLYDWLPENSKTLSDGSELVFIDVYCDILSPDGYRAILEGEVHQFVQNDNKTWTNVPNETNSVSITLTQEEFEILCQPVE